MFDPLKTSEVYLFSIVGVLKVWFRLIFVQCLYHFAAYRTRYTAKSINIVSLKSDTLTPMLQKHDGPVCYSIEIGYACQ